MNFDLMVESILKESENDINETKAIDSAKASLYKCIVDLATMCCSKEVEGNVEFKEPTRQEFEALKTKILNKVKNLDEIKRNFTQERREAIIDLVKEIRHKVERINYDELDFETPEETEKSVMRRDREGDLDPEHPELGKSRKTVRYNDDIYQDLKSLFTTLLPKGSNLRHTDLVRDQLNDKEKLSYNQRYKEMENAIINGSDEDYRKARNAEKGLDEITTNKNAVKELTAQKKSMRRSGELTQDKLKEIEVQMHINKKAQDRAYKQANTQIKTQALGGSITNFLKANNITKISPSKVNGLIEELREPGNEIYILGPISGDAGSGNLALMKQFSGGKSEYNGMKIIFVDAASRRAIKSAGEGATSDRELNADVKGKVSFHYDLTNKVMEYIRSKSSVKTKFNY